MSSAITATGRRRGPGRRFGKDNPGKPFQKGSSGNPGGRGALTDVQALAREHTPEAIAALARGLTDPKQYVAAATALLDRGWGRPTVVPAGDEERPVAIHFSWADAAPQPLPAETAAPSAPVIDTAAEAEPADNGALTIEWQTEDN
jgi:hypothetical protein